MLQLKVETGLDLGKALDLHDGEYVVGRSSKCKWPLTSDDRVSREHCVIRVLSGRASLSNLSKQGTFLVGSGPIEGPVVLEDGMSFRLGFSETQFVVSEESEDSPSTSEFEPKSSFMPTGMLRVLGGEPFDDGPLTRDDPVVTEAFVKKELGVIRRTRLLLFLGLAAVFVVGAVLIFWRHR